MKTAIIIGRFQVPYLHEGHKHIINYAFMNYDKVVILLGTGDEGTERSPYSIKERIEMLKKDYPKIFYISLLFDKESDEEWSKQVDFLCYPFVYENPVLLYSRDSFKDHYSGKIPTLEVSELPGYSGTKLRKEYGKIKKDI